MKSRPLSSSEQLVWLISQTFPGKCCIIGKFEGNIDSNVVKLILNDLKKKHPLLNVNINSLNQIPTFIGNSNELAFSSEEFSHDIDNSWLYQAQDLINYNQHDLVSAKLLSQGPCHFLIFSFNHCLGDGISGLNLVHDLYTMLNKLPYKAETMLGKSLESCLGINNTTAADISISPLLADSDKTLIINKKIDPITYKKLKEEAKYTNVSIHSLLSGKIHQQMHKLLKSETHHNICYSLHPIDMRKFFSAEASDKEFAYYLSRIDIPLPCENTDYSEIAGIINKSLRNQIKHGEHIEMIHGFRHFLERLKNDNSLIRHAKFRYPAVLISNMGEYELPGSYSIELQELHTCFPAHSVLGHSYSCAVTIVVLNENAYLNFHFPGSLDNRPQICTDFVNSVLMG